MKLSAPKQTTWLLSLALGVLGLLGTLVTIPVITGIAFWLVLAGLVISLLGAMLPGF